MGVMNKSLQKSVIAKQLKKAGVEPDLVDLHALVDSNLTLSENIKAVGRHIGKELYVDGDIINNKRLLVAEVDSFENELDEHCDREINKLVNDDMDEEDGVINNILNICSKNTDYIDFLKEIVSFEGQVYEAFGGFWQEGDGFIVAGERSVKPYGWELSDIEGLSGGHISYLYKNKIVKYGYKSQKYSYYQLVDFEKTKKALEKVKDMDKQKKAEGELWLGGGFLSTFRYTDDEVRQFEEILAGGDALDYWFPAIAPKIIGMEKQKKSILLSLASLSDKFESKNRCHTLLYGKPETAKTKLAKIVVRLGGGWASVRSTKVGLTADCSGSEITYGALPRNHNGICGIDEIDKFSSDDQSGCLDSMEEGEIPIAVGKHQTTLNAETIIVATANMIKNLKPELVSRFDFVVRCDLPNIRQAQDIADDMIEWWNKPKSVVTVELGKYLKWVRDFEPDLPQSVRDKAKEIVKQYIAYSRETRPRTLESILRIALSIARLNHRDVKVKDIQRAIEFLNGMREDLKD